MSIETDKPSMDFTESVTALENFVFESDDLLALEARIGQFNIFKAIGISRAELRHSNFLAFILDPSESHGLGQLFLKAVLLDLLKRAPKRLWPVSPIDLDVDDLRGVEVKREWRNIDVLITCKVPQFAVVVENKVDSDEHSDQLCKYESTMDEALPHLPRLFVFLTPDCREPSRANWIRYSYRDIYHVLQRVRTTNQRIIRDDLLVFLDHYLNLLQIHFMNDQTIDELCRKIYKQHRIALDLIWERARKSATIAVLANILADEERWHLFHQTANYVEFVPKTWLAWLPALGTYEEKRYWIIAHVRSDEENLVLTMFVGPMTDPAKREEVVTKLRELCPNFGFKKTSKSGEIGDTWVRITSAQTILECEGEMNDSRKVLDNDLKKVLSDLYLRLENLSLALKTMFDVRPSA